jgi:glycosyltransferase involved in cell wall biosynthesis
MRVRIFAAKDYGLEKYLNFVRLDMAGSSSKPWSIEHCSPVKWVPTGPADIHIYLDTPVRLAVPWASFNVFANPFPMVPPPWAWASNEMDLIVKMEDLIERKTAIDTFRRVFRAAIKGNHPPALPIEPAKGTLPPKVGIITVTRNRKEWWANMLQNVVKQTWPVSRLEWILVDDGDEDQRLGVEVDAFMEKTPGIMIRYVEMLTPKSIGAKRNAAVAAASGDVDVFVCMDDDDHYPKDSVGRRVSWLTRNIASSSSSSSSSVTAKKDKKERLQSQIGYCSVLPMYDLTRYISAINVPELEIGPAERVSEATLVFTREAWMARPFPEVSMAEGLGFIDGREELTVEIPPKDVIVSFIHKGNTSSRRMPKDQEPNGCHYGFADEYFSYVHEIGMKK